MPFVVRRLAVDVSSRHTRMLEFLLQGQRVRPVFESALASVGRGPPGEALASVWMRLGGADCQAEAELADQSNGRVTVFYDAVLKENLYAGDSWKKECKKIIAQLPQKVYISFDIDGLDPKLCPATGTPVPGGLEFEQAVYLIKQLVKSGREIIGFDLCEVAPGDSEWNGNVGARMLMKLINWMAVSQSRLEAQF